MNAESPTQFVLNGLLVFSSLYATIWLLNQAYLVLIYPYYVSPLRHLPGPKDHHFLLGQTVNQFRAGHPSEPFRSWMRKWPKEPLIRYFGFANADAVLVNSVGAYKDATHTMSYSFTRTKQFRRLIQDIVGVGIVFAEGDDHKSQRRVLRGLFTPSNLKNYLPVFRAKAAELCHDFEKKCDTGGMVEVKVAYSKATLDVIGIFALGIELHNFENPSDFLRCYQTVFDPSRAGMILAAINLVVPIRWLPLAANRSFVSANAHLRTTLTDLTRRRIADLRSGRDPGLVATAGAKDLLTFMVEEKVLNEPTKGGEDDEHWTEGELVEQLLNFVATGHETTASALTWATQCLGLYPHVAKRLREEVTEMFDRNPEPTYADIEGLHYLNNFAREVVRVYCPVTGIPRQAITDVVIAGQPIPRGTTVIIMPNTLQRNPEIWGPDADVFDPDRFDRLTGNAADAFAWVAFGHGPRSCIGKALAWLNFKTVVMELARNFEFEAVNKGHVEVVNPAGQLRPKDGLWFRVSKVSKMV